MSQLRRPCHEEQALANEESEKDESSPLVAPSARAAPTRKLPFDALTAVSKQPRFDAAAGYSETQLISSLDLPIIIK
eukprot:IDg5093t1